MGRLAKAIVPALVLVAAYYAVFGGEYSLLELRGARAAVAAERAELAALDERIDSLQARSDSLRNDPATLERVAREQYGMIRDGEVLYRFAPADASREGEDEDEDDELGGGA